MLPRKQRKGDEREREALSSSALDLGKQSSSTWQGKKGEPERVWEAEEGAGFPCGELGRGRTLDSASRAGFQARGSGAPWLLQGSSSLLKALSTGVLSSPGLRPPNRTGKILLRSLSERARGWSDSASDPVREEGLQFWKSSPCG